ncbi:MAG: hypothetical protein CMO80_10655 [Verrucomicrobiales bacterium]|nr:hypothetical protein [Verrucomicrobiales bacterium]|tara:strand:+ start:230 stop:472 length:243 start_codon:yes stop_codon:yes gene_type:complete
MEGETEDLHADVDGVSGELTIGPVPVVAVLDDETGVFDGLEVVFTSFDEINGAGFFYESGGSNPCGCASFLCSFQTRVLE